MPYNSTKTPTVPVALAVQADNGAAAEKSPLDKLKAVYLSVFIDVLGIGLVIPVLPYLILSFDGARASEVGLVIACYSICQVWKTHTHTRIHTYTNTYSKSINPFPSSFSQIPGSAIFGYISDIKGRKPVLLLSILASAISFLLCGLARTLPLIIAARGFSGLTGGSISVAQAYIADVTTIEERPKYLGLIGATIGIAFTFGPGIGAAAGAIIEAAGGDVQAQYSGVFYLAAAFGLLGFIFAYRNLEEAEKKPVPAKSEVAKVESSMLVWLLVISFAMFSSNYAFTVMQSTYGVLIKDEFGWATSALGAILVVSGLEVRSGEYLRDVDANAMGELLVTSLLLNPPPLSLVADCCSSGQAREFAHLLRRQAHVRRGWLRPPRRRSRCPTYYHRLQAATPLHVQYSGRRLQVRITAQWQS